MKEKIAMCGIVGLVALYFYGCYLLFERADANRYHVESCIDKPEGDHCPHAFR